MGGSESLTELEAAIVNRSGLKGTTHKPPELQNVFVEPIDRYREAFPTRAIEFRALLRAPILF